jgi:TonB family protein
MPKPVSCEHFEDLAVLFALGELEGPARSAVESHALACPSCAALLKREIALAAMLAPPGEDEPTDLLLSHCRNKLARALDDAGRVGRPRAWASVFSPKDWLAALRLSPTFHPAWSVAALVMVAAVSGMAGWEGIGREPLQLFGPTVITVSAAPPPHPSTAASATDRSTPQASVPIQPEIAPTTTAPVVETADINVYSATDAAMNNAFRSAPFESAFVPEPLQDQLPGTRPDFETDPAPRSRRNAAPLRLPAGLGPNAPWDAPAQGGLSDLSRRMETLWWGGVRVDPAEQQKRLVVGALPEYPEVARRAGIQGPVTLLVRIGKDGSVEDAELLSGEPVLGRAAAEAVEQWHYSPLRIGGQSVPIVTSVSLAFQLR